MTTSAKNLLNFINASPSCFHVIENLKAFLVSNGYTELLEKDSWDLSRGGKYFTARNCSSLIAFELPQCDPRGFMIAAAHSDSPTFKIKEAAESVSAHTVRLSTEKYGGMLMSTWLDRPLSVAGRVVVKTDSGISSRLVNIDRDLLIIPSVAIHMNRSANENAKFAANVDTLPIYAGEEAKDSFDTLVASTAGVSKDDILGRDLYLYLRESGTVFGANNEFLGSPKLDDLECAYSIANGIVSSNASDAIKVMCVFDNEEVGSETKQGGGSTLLRDTLRRVVYRLYGSEDEYLRLLANSFMVSADNAHATHPNHPEYADAANSPKMNGGIVIKHNANQKYATDGVSAAIFKKICEDADVPCQVYANRSDLAGGSTLGSISNTLLPVKTVDIGLAQLAMHSAYETAGKYDLDHLINAMTAFYSSNIIEVE